MGLFQSSPGKEGSQIPGKKTLQSYLSIYVYTIFHETESVYRNLYNKIAKCKQVKIQNGENEMGDEG